jgi:AcrR family transcriptional regulator
MIPGVATKDRILDSAEKLFGINGFEATSLRDITTDANVNLAAVNYHFQSKDSLIDAVIARRIEPVNRRRLEMLDAAGPDPTVEQVLTAFLTPALELELEPVLPLLGRILTNQSQFLDRVYKRHLVQIQQRFRAALVRALPELPETEAVWRMHFMVGVMTHLLTWGTLLPAMTDGICELSDRQAVIRRAVRFLAAGFRSAAPGHGARGTN